MIVLGKPKTNSVMGISGYGGLVSVAA